MDTNEDAELLARLKGQPRVKARTLAIHRNKYSNNTSRGCRGSNPATRAGGPFAYSESDQETVCMSPCFGLQQHRSGHTASVARYIPCSK